MSARWTQFLFTDKRPDATASVSAPMMRRDKHLVNERPDGGSIRRPSCPSPTAGRDGEHCAVIMGAPFLGYADAFLRRTRLNPLIFLGTCQMGDIQLHWAMVDDPRFRIRDCVYARRKNRDQHPLSPVNLCRVMGVDAVVDRRYISQDLEKTNLTGDCDYRR